MPELPEVETTRRGIEPHIQRRTLTGLTVREPRLRWPVSLPDDLVGSVVGSVRRRAKYLLIELADRGSLIVHLGMSGSLRIVTPDTAVLKHDHVDLVFDDDCLLRFNDPRRFGSLHWCDGPVLEHPLLRDLGPEPLDTEFDGNYLFRASRGRRVPVKTFLMNAHVVVGVGNIYANEALFLAGVRPRVRASRLSRASCTAIADSIRAVLAAAIQEGGTTLRDFVNSDGQPGYFVQSLNVYGREGAACRRCDTLLKGVRLGGRATVYCPNCQRAQSFAADGAGKVRQDCRQDGG